MPKNSFFVVVAATATAMLATSAPAFTAERNTPDRYVIAGRILTVGSALATLGMCSVDLKDLSYSKTGMAGANAMDLFFKQFTREDKFAQATGTAARRVFGETLQNKTFTQYTWDGKAYQELALPLVGGDIPEKDACDAASSVVKRELTQDDGVLFSGHAQPSQGA